MVDHHVHRLVSAKPCQILFCSSEHGSIFEVVIHVLFPWKKYLMLDECWRWIQRTGVNVPYFALHVQVMGSTSTSWNSQTGNRDLRQNRSRKKKLLERGNMEERLQTNPQIFDTVCIDFSGSRWGWFRSAQMHLNHSESNPLFKLQHLLKM